MKNKIIMLSFSLLIMVASESVVQAAAESAATEPTSRGQFGALSDYDIAKIAESLSVAELEKWSETSKDLNTMLTPILQYKHLLDYWTKWPGQIGQDIPAHEKQINVITWAHDGTLIATGSDDSTIVLWNKKKDNPYVNRQKILTGHTGAITSVAFSPDKKMLVSAGLDGMIALWNVATGTISKRHVGLKKQFNAALFSHDGKFLAYTSSLPGQGKAVKILNLKTNETTSKPLPAADKLMQLAFLPDDDALAIFTETKTNNYEIITWNFKTGQEKKGEKIVKFDGGITSAHPEQKEGPYAVAFSQDVKLCAMGYPLSIVIVDVQTGKKTADFSRDGIISSLAFSPNDSFVAVSNLVTNERSQTRSRLAILNTKKNIFIHLGSNANKITIVSFSPNGKIVASGLNNGEFGLFQHEV